WDDVDVASTLLNEWAQFDISFIETPLWTDDIPGYARLSEQVPMRVAAGEWLATRFEFEELMDRGKVGVAQPDIGRVGGLSEAMVVAEMAAERGISLVPHCWKTGVSVAATAHYAFANAHCEFIEYLPPQLCIETL